MSSVSTSLRHIVPGNSSTTAIAAFRRVPCCVDGRKLASRNARRRAPGLRADEKRWGNVKAVTSPDCDGPMTATGRSNVPILSGSESKRCSSVEVTGWNDIIGGEYMDELIAISTGFRNFSRSLSDCSKYLLLHSSDRAVIHRAESLGSYNWLTSDVVERLKAFHENRTGEQNYSAMYSSIFGGITTDSAAMVIPMDDHMVHRGHGVFDTAAIMDGHLYELDQHLDRFLRSASMAKIQLPFDRSTIRSILIQTVSASKCMQGSLRYWLSPGPGDFLLSPSGCPNPALYAIVIEGSSLPVCSGVKVITSSIPMKSQQFAVMKNVNYLPNALSKMEAEENGAFAAIWLDDEGFVAEGPNMNVAFVTADKELLMPYFNKVLSGCTAKRVLSLAEELVADGRLSGIKSRNITVREGKTAEEMMLIGSGIVVKPVLQWDDHVIGAGEEGPVAQALFELILDDMKYGPPSVRTSVPY